MLKDGLVKTFLGQPEVFADAFNVLLHDGRQVIQPQMLNELDPNEIYISDKNEPVDVTLTKERDILKEMTLMDYDGMTYAILGIEGQCYIDYGMVVRNMVYDASRYAKQLKKKMSQNEKLSAEELGEHYISKVLPDDKLHPVITLVLYFSNKPWTAPRNLHAILDTTDADILKFVPDYRLNLLCPHDMSDDYIHKFRSDLAPVLCSLKYKNNKREFFRKVVHDSIFKQVHGSSIRFISEFTGIDLGKFQNKEIIDMSEKLMTIPEVIAAERVEAKAEGIIEGKAEGKAEGIIEIMLSMNRTKKEICDSLMKLCSMSKEQAMRAIKCKE